MRHLPIILLILFCISCTKDDISKDESECDEFSFSDTYDYQIDPKSDEWKKLNSHKEMVAACQIPAETLKVISTEGLVESMLNYPLILDFMVSEELQNYFNDITDELNGFKELYQREDLYDVFTQRYEKMSLYCKKNPYPPFGYNIQTPSSISFMIFECLLFQDKLLDSINIEQQYFIFDLVYDKLQIKEDLDFSGFGKLASSAILGKIMYKNNFLPFMEICNKTEFMEFFIEQIPVIKPQDYYPTDTIIKYATEFKASR